MAVRRQLSVDDYYNGVISGNRASLARAITLIESTNATHQDMAQQLLLRLMPHSGHAHRVGITGVPGVGKSTTIEKLGTMLCDAGHKVAVLAVDPSSQRSGGSILGDKTRMDELAQNDNAFIRPSPSSGRLGGVSRATRESIIVCEAAGFDVVLVETVGVGQSETVVAKMVDFFLVLMLPGAGDELQGIKKGVLEIADMIAVNKCDGENAMRAKLAGQDYQNALRIIHPKHKDWLPPVQLISGLVGTGLPELWQKIQEHHRLMSENGYLDDVRMNQQIDWMWSMVDDQLKALMMAHPDVANLIPHIEHAIRNKNKTPTQGVLEIIAAFTGKAERKSK